MKLVSSLNRIEFMNQIIGVYTINNKFSARFLSYHLWISIYIHVLRKKTSATAGWSKGCEGKTLKANLCKQSAKYILWILSPVLNELTRQRIWQRSHSSGYLLKQHKPFSQRSHGGLTVNVYLHDASSRYRAHIRESRSQWRAHKSTYWY